MIKSILLLIPILVIFLSFPSYAAQKALLVGVGNYKAFSDSPSRERLNLQGPRNDVEVLKNSLLNDRFGFSANAIRVLTDAQATKKNIKDAFLNWLIKETQKDDLTVFYFSGHGADIPWKNDKKIKALLPHDTVPNGGENIITEGELEEWLEKLKGRIVVIIDACYSGGLARSVIGKSMSMLEEMPSCRIKYFPLPIINYRPSPNAEPVPKAWRVPLSGVFMAAADKDEKAWDYKFPDGFHGAFTYGLIKGMIRISSPSYEGLFDYAKQEVARLNLPQKPQLIPRTGIVVEPAFKPETPPPPPKKENASQPTKVNKPVPPKPVTDNKPVAPPEIKGEKILLALGKIKGAASEELNKIREGLAKLPFVTIVQETEFFDRLLRGEFKKGRYQARLLNRIGDAVQLPLANKLEALIGSIGGQLETDYIVKQLARLHNPHPPFAVKVWVTDPERKDFMIGENIEFNFSTEEDCYLLMININKEGDITILYPNRFHSDNFVKGGSTIKIPGDNMKFDLQFFEPAGAETVKVIATKTPLKLSDIGINDINQYLNAMGMVELKKEVGQRTIKPVERINHQLSSGRFTWSEAMVEIRSYQKK